MSASWVTPATAVAAVEDLLALMLSGYTVELVPLDLIGPDRAVLRLTALHGEPVDPHEVRVASMRGLGAGIRDLRRLALGDDAEESGVEPSADPAAPPAGQGDALSMGLMAALMGMGDPGAALGQETGGRRVAPASAAAMADAIAATIRPGRITSGRRAGAGVVPSDPEPTGDGRDAASDDGGSTDS